jgi:hypothetical protein
MSKCVYQIEESTFDTRHYVITTDAPLKDSEGDIIDLICHVSITEDGDTIKMKTEDGVKAKVTFIGTEYGDDAQMDWTETELDLNKIKISKIGEENG